MTYRLYSTVAAIALGLAACSEPSSDTSSTESAPEVTADESGPAVLIDGPDATKDLETFISDCAANLEETKALIASIKSYEGPLSEETVLKPLNDLSLLLDNSVSWPYLMGVVHPNTEYRDAADACVQEFIPLYSDIGLSREIYDQIKGLDISGADGAVTFLVSESIQGFESSGVNRDEETREK